jgi:hypothetical protein
MAILNNQMVIPNNLGREPPTCACLGACLGRRGPCRDAWSDQVGVVTAGRWVNGAPWPRNREMLGFTNNSNNLGL